MNLCYTYLKRIGKYILVILIVIGVTNCEKDEPEPKSIVIETDCGELRVSFDFQSDYNFTPGFEVKFINNSTPNIKYLWDFGDGSFSEEFSPTHIFDEKKEYNVSLTGFNLCSNSTLCRKLLIGYDTINNASACFEFTSTFYFEAGSSIMFTNCSKNAEKVNWYFGDGNSTNDTTPVHTYETEGAYKVMLVVSNTFSSDSVIKEIHITKKSDKYIDFNNQLLTLNKYSYSEKVSANIESKTVTLNLASNEITLPELMDTTWTIYGKGSVVHIEWVINENLHTGTYNQLANAWMIPFNNHDSQTNTRYDIKNGTIEILNLNPFEFIYKSEIATIYYKDERNYSELTLPLSELETRIKNSQDSRASFTYAQYEQLLKILAQPKFEVVTINEMRNTYNPSKVIVGMRHDVDCHPFKALKLMELEQSYGLKASYYILSTSPYYGSFYKYGVKRYACMEEVYKQLAGGGNEIGIHNDLLSVMILKKLDPMDFNCDELFFYKQLGIPIYGSVAHGSSLAGQLMSNYNMFSDFATTDYVTYKEKTYPIGTYSMLEYGFLYEANFVGFNQYFSDSGGRWNGGITLQDIFNWLENSKPGDRVQFLCHPVWWGKE